MVILQFQILLHLLVTNRLTNPFLLLYIFLPHTTCNLLNHRKNFNVHFPCPISIFSSSPVSFHVLSSLFSHTNHFPHTLLLVHNISSILLDLFHHGLRVSQTCINNANVYFGEYPHIRNDWFFVFSFTQSSYH